MSFPRKREPPFRICGGCSYPHPTSPCQGEEPIALSPRWPPHPRCHPGLEPGPIPETLHRRQVLIIKTEIPAFAGTTRWWGVSRGDDEYCHEATALETSYRPSSLPTPPQCHSHESGNLCFKRPPSPHHAPKFPSPMQLIRTPPRPCHTHPCRPPRCAVATNGRGEGAGWVGGRSSSSGGWMIRAGRWLPGRARTKWFAPTRNGTSYIPRTVRSC